MYKVITTLGPGSVRQCSEAPPSVHLQKLRHKGKMVTHDLCKLHATLDSSKPTAIQRVLRAKLLPSLNYAQQAFPGMFAQDLDKIHCTAYKKIFRLPTCTRNTLIRLEFDLNQQKLEELAAMTKYFYLTTAAPDNSMKALIKSIFLKPSNPWSARLTIAKDLLHLATENWEPNIINYATIKTTIKRQLRSGSCILDMGSLATRDFHETLCFPQILLIHKPHVKQTVGRQALHWIFAARLYPLPLKELYPSWKARSGIIECRLCNYKESTRHTSYYAAQPCGKSAEFTSDQFFLNWAPA